MSPQEQREARQDTDLTPLTESYELVAELRGRDNGRAFIGKRREDGADVLIFLLRASRETGDRDDLATSDRKSLTLFAADAKLLAGLSHPNMLPILDGRWVGQHSFAVVTQRTTAPTLEELIERNEPLSSQRIGDILRQVNGLLEWARGETVTHRGVRPDTLFVEPATDRVLAAFVMRPLPVSGAIEPEADARTIAELAYAMLSRGAELVERHDEKKSETENETEKESEEEQPPALAQLRPDLPVRLAKETERILRVPLSDSPDTPTDVLSYIALVTMGDSLKVLEDDTNRVRAELAEEQRVGHEAIETERTTFDRTRDEEMRKFTEQRDELQAALAKEREEMQRTLAKEREEMQRALAKEQERLSKERTDLQRAIEKERKKFEEARLDLERAIASEREEIGAEREALERIGGEAVRYREETQQQMRELEERRVTLAKESKVTRDKARDAQREVERAAEVTAAELSASAATEPMELPTPSMGSAELPFAAAPASETRDDRPVTTELLVEREPELERVEDKRQSRIRRTVGISLGMVAITVAAALATMNRLSSGDAEEPRGKIVDSASGGVALRRTPATVKPTVTYSSVVPLPVPTEEITTALEKVWTPRKRRPRPRPVIVDTTAFDATTAPALLTPPPTAPVQIPSSPDGLLRRDTTARRDTLVRRDTIRPRPDSVVKPPLR